MSETLTVNLNGQLTATLQNLIGVDATTSATRQSLFMSLANGTGEGSANQIFSDQRTLAPGGSFITDLVSFSGSNDKVGNPLALANVKLLFVYNYGTVPADNQAFNEAGTLVVGGAPAGARGWVAPLSGTVTLNGTSGWLLYDPGATGYPVPSGSGNNLIKVANPGSNNVQFTIIVAGATS